VSPYNSGKAGGQEAPIVPLKMGYLRWPTLVISAVAPLDISHGLEWAMGTGPWGGRGHSTGRVGQMKKSFLLAEALCRIGWSFHPYPGKRMNG